MTGFKTRKSSFMKGMEYFSMKTKKTTTPDKIDTCGSGVAEARTSASLSTRVSSDGSSSSSGLYQENYLSQYHQSLPQPHRASSPHARPPRLHSKRSYNDNQEHYAFPCDHDETNEDPNSQQASKKTVSSYTPNTTDTTLSMSINSSYADDEADGFDEVDGLFNDEIQDLGGSNIENFKQKIHRSQGSYGSNSGIQSAMTGVITIGTTEDSIFGLLEGMKDPHYSPHAHLVGVVGEDNDANDDDKSHHNDSGTVQHENVVFEQQQDPEVLSSSLPSRDNNFKEEQQDPDHDPLGKKNEVVVKLSFVKNHKFIKNVTDFVSNNKNMNVGVDHKVYCDPCCLPVVKMNA
eukprot:CAMPEP_0195281376 /NCGR_PEP_ID=MMETSP0707-20130614/712_1 /TAXON_ID=33640 /ORGANISM="Asterionellopsis glacialis, Strain CCMP134" /LENGTH=346 /DNA_ID=CAMNT_0040340257 /DNA_START=183 /DNA_END=1224 /DNA_ORIENTATION=-